MADDVLYQGVKGVTDLMVRPGLINLDFADVRSVMDEMGKAMMGTGEASGEDRAVQAAEKAIANPLLDEISLSGARGVLINITGGNDLTLFELDEAANRVRDEVDPEANIIVGSTLDAAMEGSLRVSVVATGIDVSNFQSDVRSDRHNSDNGRNEFGKTLNVRDQALDGFSKIENNPEGGYLNREAIDGVENTSSNRYVDKQNGKDLDKHSKVNDIQSGASGPKTVSETARERLMAAVQKNPDSGHYRRPSHTVTSELPKSGGGAFNNLIQRMTGHKSRNDLERNPFVTKKTTSVVQNRDSALTKNPNDGGVSEVDRLEVPAFLRRQAN
jgi:cell division protein FtsZ